MQAKPDQSAVASRSDQVGPDGIVETGNLRLPFSVYASAEARQAFLTDLAPVSAEIASDLAALRRHYGAFNDRLRDRMLERFDVDIVTTEIAGVPVHRVTPMSQGLESDRVLLNLHGGAFMWGSGSGALVEAIPVAATSGMPVIVIDYRLAPEHTFPAASDDVQAVYAALLATTPAHSIGIYGCSAGAILTAQCVAQFLERGLPLPGGIAMLGGAGLMPLGDSLFTAQALSGERSESDGMEADPLLPALRPYLQGVAFDDPRVAPGAHPEILSRFPPSLLIAGSRDFAASSVTTMHRRLVARHVDAELFVFDGLWHAFHIFPELPESHEVYGLLARFFTRTLTPGK